MATAHARHWVGQLVILGEGEMHTISWEKHDGWGETNDTVQGRKVTVMRDKDGSFHVVPTEEINELFQVVE